MVDPILPHSTPPAPNQTGSTSPTQQSISRSIQNVASTSATSTHQALHTSEIEKLLQRLNISGTMVSEIKTVQILDKKALQLLDKVNPSLAQQLPQKTRINGNNAANSTLYLVKLILNQQTLVTITPALFKVGDKIQLQLNHQQQIIVKPSPTTLRPAIIEGLRQVLPQQQSTSQLLNTVRLLQNLPPDIQQVLLSKPVLAQLKTLTTFISREKNITTSESIKNTLKNSGVFLENKLQTEQNLQSDLRTTLSKLQARINTEILTSMPNNTPAQQAPLLSSKTIDMLLGQLLQHYHIPLPSKPTLETNLQALSNLLLLLGIKSDPAKAVDTYKIREAMNQQINKMIQGVQEKIHLNQLRALHNNEASVMDRPPPLPSLHIEIPLRWGEQVLPLHLSMQGQVEEETREPDSQASETESNITRRWQVFLSFDLPNNEQLFTQLILINNSVSATIWTESHTLCEKTKQHLPTLCESFLANGLEVDDLHCIEGKPPSQELSLDYNLVNITT
ncbi:hypothetical protein AB835_02390 [Candidatus Endobugula sertula]|uniref:Uncharacterized protein n=1 Tax=Candidatus Endobugula sertula TaxID=62101 RepID=A0A1D2QT52_9GAMM|nr:hypothetical protein AB835_02390 [Candidatus Endobugula sertula]